MRKSAVFYIAVAANANEQDTNVTTIDTNQNQQIKGVHVGITTAGMTLFVKVSGQTKLSVDASYFSAGNGALDCDFTVPAQQPITIGLQDLTAAGNARVPVTFLYDVPGS